MRVRLKKLMKHKYAILGSLVVCLFCFCSFALAVNRAKYVPDAISIRNEDDFYKINDNLSGYYVLADSITFSKPIQPIGSPKNPFTGTFDGLGRYNLKNIVFDFAQLDFEKYSMDDVVNIGLFSCNEGTIIHNELAGVSFENASQLKNAKINIGILCGNNKGKITSNVSYAPNSSINLGCADEICFGLLAGTNTGEIRRNKIIGHINCSLNTVNTINLGGFSGHSGGNSIHEMLQYNGNISIYNSDESLIKNIFCGSVCGTCNGGIIRNCDLQKASVLNMKKNCNYSRCGGVVGCIVSPFAEVSISSCVVTGTIKSCATMGNYVSSCVGKIEDTLKIELFGILIGGDCDSYSSRVVEEKTSDLYYSENENINQKNCKVLDDYRIKSPSIRHVDVTTSLNNLTIDEMGWDDSYWSIEKSTIHLKAFDL